MPPKKLHPIIGGILTLESGWNPALGQPLAESLNMDNADGRLDIGCIAAQGRFSCDSNGTYKLFPQGKPATAFHFELIARLQDIATVPMIDIRAYSEWLAK